MWELLQNITIHYTSPVNTTITPAEAEEERSAVRKLALAALQFLANLTAGNPRTASWVFEESYDGRFLEYLEAFSEDRDLLMCTCVIIHNHLACAVEKCCAVEKLLEDGALICKLMRILLPQSISSPPPSSSSEEEKSDPVFEWVYLILLKILEAGEGKEAFGKSGLDEDSLQDALVLLEPVTERETPPGYTCVMPHPPLLSVPPPWHRQGEEPAKEGRKEGGREGGLEAGESEAVRTYLEPPLPVFTAEQLVFLNLLEHSLTDTYVHKSSGSRSLNAEHKEGNEGKEERGVRASSLLVTKDEGAMLVEMVSRVKTFLKYRSLYMPRTNALGPSGSTQHGCGEVIMIEEAVATVVRLLAGVLAMEVEEEEGGEEGHVDKEALVANGLVGVILTLLRQEGGQADGCIPSMDPIPTAATAATGAASEGRKAQLIRLLGNLCHRCRSAQDEVRKEEGGLVLVLNHCNVDSSNPFLREWALFCIRNLCEGNEENQRVVGEVQVQEVVQTSILKEAGLRAKMVEGGEEGGRARVILTTANERGGDGGK